MDLTGLTNCPECGAKLVREIDDYGKTIYCRFGCVRDYPKKRVRLASFKIGKKRRRRREHSEATD